MAIHKRSSHAHPAVSQPRTALLATSCPPRQERLLNVIQGKTPALPRDRLDAFLSAPPPWEILCTVCGIHAIPSGSPKKGLGGSKMGGGEGGDDQWPAVRCLVCWRPKHIECLPIPHKKKVRLPSIDAAQLYCGFVTPCAGAM